MGGFIVRRVVHFIKAAQIARISWYPVCSSRTGRDPIPQTSAHPAFKRKDLEQSEVPHSVVITKKMFWPLHCLHGELPSPLSDYRHWSWFLPAGNVKLQRPAMLRPVCCTRAPAAAEGGGKVPWECTALAPADSAACQGSQLWLLHRQVAGWSSLLN